MVRASTTHDDRQGHGLTAVQEWKRTMPTSEPGHVLRGTSVRRVVDGLTVYAADYYDTALPD